MSTVELLSFGLAPKEKETHHYRDLGLQGSRYYP